MRLKITIFSLLLLAGCAQSEIIGCPEVKVWSNKDHCWKKWPLLLKNNTLKSGVR
jgi:hypothetical protein